MNMCVLVSVCPPCVRRAKNVIQSLKKTYYLMMRFFQKSSILIMKCVNMCVVCCECDVVSVGELEIEDRRRITTHSLVTRTLPTHSLNQQHTYTLRADSNE
jgi:hypothetical protein